MNPTPSTGLRAGSVQDKAQGAAPPGLPYQGEETNVFIGLCSLYPNSPPWANAERGGLLQYESSPVIAFFGGLWYNRDIAMRTAFPFVTTCVVYTATVVQ